MEVGEAEAAGLFLKLSAAMQLQDLLPPGVPHQDQSTFPQVPASSPQKKSPGFCGIGQCSATTIHPDAPQPSNTAFEYSFKHTECFIIAFHLIFWHTFKDSPYLDSHAQDKPNSEVFIILLHHSICKLHTLQHSWFFSDAPWFFPWGSKTFCTLRTSYTPGLRLWVLQRLFSSTP